jgi:hypothetical protein
LEVERCDGMAEKLVRMINVGWELDPDLKKPTIG